MIGALFENVTPRTIGLLLIGFAIHHVYSGLLVSIVERNGTMDSIFSGWKFFPRHDLETPAAGPAPKPAAKGGQRAA